jgi:ring-1,2-phenylacetyl-CoA epoxidase subunit PaaA
MLPEGAWITHAPNLRRKMVLMAKVQDEAGHGQYLYHAAESLGVDREELLQALLDGRAKYASIFNYPTMNWADVAWVGWLVDGAAIKNQTMLAQCSFGPYSRAMVRICAEETFHFKQGKEMIANYMLHGTEKQKTMVQDGLTRWWWPTLMMFGPHDSESTNSAILTRWGIKTKSNDTLRQEFINENVPEILELGLTLPDPDLKFNEETDNWDFGEIDWEEFWSVIKGNGAMNQYRLGARQKAHDDGQWVREAMAAYAEKQMVVAAD